MLAGATFSDFYMATNPHPMSYQYLGYLWSRSKVGARSQLMTLPAVVIAFVTGMYATLAHSVGLAVTVCAIGCISFIMHVWVVLSTVCWILSQPDFSSRDGAYFNPPVGKPSHSPE
ncbi:hypothetical protein CQW23_12990 [Capsicum baccatum]|uniref:Uncharacterized protein n=1 Tax=Capsicum baccatum TaxID=33114 RepID=A0A2G2WU99_CAPBA|nr:hypothetical protein CQW23_12990 [Capsicum baccatum]